MVSRRRDVWYYVFYINGRRYRGSTKTNNEIEALPAEAGKRVAAEQNESLRLKPVPLELCWNWWNLVKSVCQLEAEIQRLLLVQESEPRRPNANGNQHASVWQRQPVGEMGGNMSRQ